MWRCENRGGSHCTTALATPPVVRAAERGREARVAGAGTSVPISAQREQTGLFPFGKRGAIRRRGADSVQAAAAHVTAAQAGTAWQGPHELCGDGMADFLDDFAPLAVRRRSCRCAGWSTLTLETLTLS